MSSDITASDWDEEMLATAEQVRHNSNDPSSQIGVVISRQRQVIAVGFNSFPVGVAEDGTRWARPLKYQYVCHAERNAIASAAREGVPTDGATLHMVGMGPPTVPCTECAKMIIQAGISRVVARGYKAVPENWVADLAFAKGLLEEAGVELVEAPAFEVEPR